MLFWIFVLIFTIGLIASIVTASKDCCGEPAFWTICMIVVSAVIGLIMLMIIICQHCGLKGTIASNETRYEILTYQLENDIYDNDNDLGKRELMVDIQKWNEDLAYNKNAQRDFWIGIFIPNIYDQFEPITLRNTN